MRKLRRYGEVNHHLFTIFTYSPPSETNYKPWSIIVESGKDEHPNNHLHISLYGHVFIMELPNFIKPHNGCYGQHSKNYGISYHNGFLQVFFGEQTFDSDTDKNCCKHLPWTQWRHVRKSWYDNKGNHIVTHKEGNKGSYWKEREKSEKMAEMFPHVSFVVEDYDGMITTAHTDIQEHEWKFGEGWFKWLCIFRKPLIVRSLNIKFDDEIGKEKGTWKGGFIGTSIDMTKEETHKDAMLRFCEQDHRSKYSKFKITYKEML